MSAQRSDHCVRDPAGRTNSTTNELIEVNPQLIEAKVAYSILFLAVELIRKQRGKQGLTQRQPWLVAFGFGLLHGAAFAGALRRIGLPEGNIPASLLLFNIGVEIGQLLFVGAAMLAIAILKRIPALSANDEFANYEIFDKLLIGTTPSKPGGSYWRDALGRGLILQSKFGVNPYKDGAAGGSDLHSGLSVSSAQEYGGIAAANLGGGKQTKEQTAQALGVGGQPISAGINAVIPSPGNLTGVWAESNTREAIYAAFRRKETFATSGSKLKVRFFGGYGFTPALLRNPGWVHNAYASGVPMGSDLPVAKGRAPNFVVQAVKDPNGGNLDRVQIVKVWVENGKQQERIFDVAWSGQRKIDQKTGKLAPVGNTVDLKTGAYTNSIGAAQLATVWTDPSFKADQAAVYYVRVLEIPTPRWSTLRALEFGLPLPANVSPTLQQRAWTSPIWYTPSGRT